MSEPFEQELTLLKLARKTAGFNFVNEKAREAFIKLLCMEIKALCPSLKANVEFARLLGVAEDGKDKADAVRAEYCRLLKKRYPKTKKLFSQRICYKYLFLAEVVYGVLASGKFSAEKLEALFKMLSVKTKAQNVFTEFVQNIIAKDSEKLFLFVKNVRLKWFAETVMPLAEFIAQEQSYYALPRVNISVFSTMSAGKSTFVNALLGHDYLPSRNEACTAKIAAIADNDHIDYCLGYAIKNGKPVFCGDVSNETLEEWNKDSEITEISLEGNLDRISSKDAVTVIHDTPGVNYSGNAEHKKLTLTHIADSRPKIIICLLDATQILTTDFNDALLDLKKGNKHNAKIIFVMNKADSFDSEKESLSACIAEIASMLKEKEYGFLDPVIIPVSSRSARLFKMALNNRVDWTKKENRDFMSYMDDFSQAENNFNAFAVGVNSVQFTKSEYTTKNKDEIVIEEKTYERQKIIDALFFTGIPAIENILNTRRIHHG